VCFASWVNRAFWSRLPVMKKQKYCLADIYMVGMQKKITTGVVAGIWHICHRSISNVTQEVHKIPRSRSLTVSQAAAFVASSQRQLNE
jgi:predicted PP-loop superfamily ATPase